MNKKVAILGLLSAAFIAVGASSLYVVHETDQAIVVQFGNPVHVEQEPGLHFKLPFIQEVIYYDKRVLDLDPPVINVLLTDKKRINVDAYARYKIVDPLEFYKRVRDEFALRDRLGKAISGAQRRVIANVSLGELLSEERVEIMARIQSEVEEQAKSLGLELIEVRIGRTELPSETSAAVYQRMRTEREREARELRAEGGETANKIRAQADKEKIVIQANAQREASRLRGEGEALRNITLAEAYNRDPDFFRFYKSMEEYEKSLVNSGLSVVISPENEFLNFLRSSN
ncbi:MAG: protease modulator HflC [Alphaproteobacteria bacterium]